MTGSALVPLADLAARQRGKPIEEARRTDVSKFGAISEFDTAEVDTRRVTVVVRGSPTAASERLAQWSPIAYSVERFARAR